MNYYDDLKAFQAKGIDYDLSACLEYNPQEGFNLLDIKQVLAVHEGENDEANWHWLIKLNNRKVVYLEGGCDYTGWDCQSDATSIICDSITEALHNVKDQNILIDLKTQLKSNKTKTWHEKMENEMPDLPKI